VKTVLALLTVAAQIVFAGAAAGYDDPTGEVEARLQLLARQLRCLVCQNETLAESQAELAVDLRREIRQQLEAGRSDAQITAFLTDRYGDFVLYRPPLKPRTYLLWFGPFVLLGGGLVALYRSVNRRPGLAGLRPLTPGEQRRARRLLEGQQREEPV
jgi:cytochrome c-type biogenesis protein CcmH